MTLKEYLVKKKLTYKQFCKKTDLDTAQISRYVCGAKHPSLKTAYKIYKATRGKVRLQDWFPDEKK